MFQFCAAQMDRLADAAARGFRARLARHLEAFFPTLCEALGPSRLDLAITLAMQRARSYGLSSEHAICLYADVMFTFGHKFDEDASLPWAASILRDPSPQSAASRIDRLHRTALAVLGALD